MWQCSFDHNDVVHDVDDDDDEKEEEEDDWLGALSSAIVCK